MKQSKQHCDLKSCFLCKLCVKEWLPAIDANRQTLSFKKGALIFKEGEPVTGIYFIYSGKVKVHKHWGNEKELIVRFAKQGDIVGHRGLGADIVYPVSGTALEPVTVCFVELAFFQASLKVNHEFIYELMMFYANELQESEKNMRNLAHMPVKGRVARALLKLKDVYGLNAAGAIDLALTRQDLASFTGTAYETVFRIMNELVEDKAIALQSKQVTILDTGKLVQWIPQL